MLLPPPKFEQIRFGQASRSLMIFPLQVSRRPRLLSLGHKGHATRRVSPKRSNGTHSACDGLEHTERRQLVWRLSRKKKRRLRQLQPSSHEDVNPFGIGGSLPLGTLGAGRTWTWSHERAGCPFSPPRKNFLRAQDQIGCHHLQPFSSRREGIGALRRLRSGRGMQMSKRCLLWWQ